MCLGSGGLAPFGYFTSSWLVSVGSTRLAASKLVFDSRVVGSNWFITFAVTCWILWKSRNDLVFNHHVPQVKEVLFRVHHMVHDCQAANRCRIPSKAHHEEVLVSWTPPPRFCLKFNTDGSVREHGR